MYRFTSTAPCRRVSARAALLLLALLAPLILAAFRLSDRIQPRAALLAAAQQTDDRSFTARDSAPTEHASAMELPADYRRWFANPDGSCVQCSLGMVGMWINRPAWTFLLWDTPYGPAERGGSGPSRVSRYASQRGMRLFNVTGRGYEDTRPWMIWAAQTGRFAAIGAGRAHFQTLYGYHPGEDRPWKVCNNNSPGRIDAYSEEEFRRLHLASGPWVVVPDEPPAPPPPRIVPWWQ